MSGGGSWPAHRTRRRALPQLRGQLKRALLEEQNEWGSNRWSVPFRKREQGDSQDRWPPATEHPLPQVRKKDRLSPKASRHLGLHISRHNARAGESRVNSER